MWLCDGKAAVAQVEVFKNQFLVIQINVEATLLTRGWIWNNWRKITHFVSSMGTTGTIMGVSKYLKEQNPEIQIVGLQPSDGSVFAGIRPLARAYLPRFWSSRVDRILNIPQIPQSVPFVNWLVVKD